MTDKTRSRACRLLTLCLAGIATLAACDQGDIGNRGAPSLEPTSAKVDDAFEAYEDLRLKLSAGETDKVSDIALELARRAREASQNQKGELADKLLQLADTANRFAKEPGALEDKRKGFGAISEIAVAIVASHAEQREGRVVYRCDEVDGYPMWVQTGGTMKNPYRDGGDCGSLVSSLGD